jgi:hypothetical protein
MTKIIVLNCPPRSGKDTIAEEFVKRDGFTMLSFKSRLIEIALLISNVSKSEWDERYIDQKDVPWERLGGLSQRQYLIKISEDWVKPIHGKTYFGKIIAENSEEYDFCILPDGGFEEEIKPLYEKYGKNLLILQWSRTGCNFDNDSRNWIIGYPANTFSIQNNDSSIEDHYFRVKRAIEHYYEKVNL